MRALASESDNESSALVKIALEMCLYGAVLKVTSAACIYMQARYKCAHFLRRGI